MILKKIRNLVLILTIAFGGLMFAAPVALAQTPKDDICKGVGIAGGGSGCDPGSGPTVDSVVAKVISIISLVVGIVAVIMVLVGGIKYVTSAGDSNNVNSAKNTILYAVVGLVVAALAQVLVRYVLKNVA